MMRCDSCGILAFVSDNRRCVAECPPRPPMPCFRCEQGHLREASPRELWGVHEDDDDTVTTWEVG